MTSHPTSEQLSAWVDDGLPIEEREQVTAHLNECEECWTIVEVVRETNEELERGMDLWGV